MNLSFLPINFKRSLRRLAARMGVYAIRARGDCDEFSNLLHMLAPFRTEHPLIRVGGKGDGGYLIPDDLDGIKTCFSPGVEAVANFESELSSRGIRSFLSDYSIEKSPIEDPKIEFQKKFLGSISSDVYCTLDKWVADCSDSGEQDMILQMDIEGSEYETILSTDQATLRRFRIIVFELHHLDMLVHPFGQKIISAFLQKLDQDFVVVHSHPNNSSTLHRFNGKEFPELLEVTFLRKDRITMKKYEERFPHPLDQACVEDLPEMKLPKSMRA